MRRLTPLAIVFGLLLILVIWRDTTRGSTRTLVEEANLRELQTQPFKPDDVTKIEVVAPGGKPAYTLEQEGKSWRVTGTFKAPASGAAVSRLAEILGKAQGEFRTDDKAVMEQFDLTPAREVRVQAYDAAGKTLVNIGVGASSMQHGAFVRNLASGADDSKALAIADDIRGALGLSRTSAGAHEAAAPEASHFHEKAFVQSPVDKPRHAEFVAPGRRLALDNAAKDPKDPAAAWTVVEGGPGLPLKKEAIEAALRALGGGFHPSALVDPAKKKELGFDAPKYRFSVTGDDGVKRAVLGTSDAAAEHFYVTLDAVQDPDVVYEANDHDFHQLFPTGAALFDLPKVDVPKEGITRLGIEKKGRETIEIARKGTKPADDWTVVQPKWPLEPKQTALRMLGNSLTSLRVTDYLDESQLADPEITLRFGTSDADMRTLQIGGKSPAGKDRLALLPGAPGHVYTIADNSIDRVAPEPLSLFETRVLHGWDKHDVTAIRTAEWSLVKDGDGWSIDEAGAKKKASQVAVDAWLDRTFGSTITGVLPEDADLKSVPLTLERKDGDPSKFGVTSTKDGKPALVLGLGVIATVDAKETLVPDRASFEEKAAPPPPEKKDEKPPEPPK